MPVVGGRLTNRHYVNYNRGGLVRALLPLGAAVKRDEPVAVLYDVFGNDLESTLNAGTTRLEADIRAFGTPATHQNQG